MTGTFYSLNLLDSASGLAAAALFGVLFGIALDQAGFSSSRKLAGVFYFRDMSVIKVMFTAVVTTLIGYQYVVAWGWLDPSGIYVLDTYWGAQIVGGLLFGIGFAVGGWCPGTALAGLASLKGDALVFLIGVALGSIFFNEIFAYVQPFYDGGHAGALLLSDTLHLSPRILVLLFAVTAVLAFSGSSWLETRHGALPPAAPVSRKRNRMLAVLMLLLAAGTFLLPSSPSVTEAASQAPTPQDSAAAGGILNEVASAQDHIDPAALADLILAGRSDLVLVDIRPPEAYANFHIRGAISAPLERLSEQATTILPKSGLVVLYSNGTTHAAQAWLALRQAGWGNMRVLTDGIAGFWRDCLTPPSLSGLIDEASARNLSDAFRARRAFFLENAAPSQAASPTVPEKPVPLPPALAEPGLAQHLVSTEWLASHLDDGGLRILDVRSKSTDYTVRHIPGALYLNIENIRATIGGLPNMLVSAENLAKMFGSLGISHSDTVIVYSDQLRDATLAVVALERVGHASYAVLHGGWGKWIDEKRVTANDLPEAKAVEYRRQEGADTFTVTVDEVQAATRDGKTRILDVRPASYFSGEKSDEPRAGHIPGAKNREFTQDLLPDTASWKSADALKEEYRKLGLAEDTPVIVACRTGHQASQTYFLLKHVLGFKDVRWFDGSWLAWSARKDLPVELGTQRSEKPQ